jgi:hypothetical protein
MPYNSFRSMPWLPTLYVTFFGYAIWGGVLLSLHNMAGN